MAVLVLSPPTDLHAQTVGQRLAELGMDVQYLSLAQILRQFNFSLKLGGSEPRCQLESTPSPIDSPNKQTSLDMSAFSAIWLRRPGKVKALAVKEPWAAKMVESESNRAVEGFFRILPCLWVNHPSAQTEAGYKFKQLDAARRCGFKVPKTLVTNDPAAVSDFYKACQGKMIYKLIDEATWQHFPDFEIPKGIPTTLFRESDLRHLEQVRLGLHLFQECIDKIADIRITVVGNKIFAVRIESQTGQGNIDFRLDYSVAMSPYRLPDEIAERCLKLLQTLSLNFGAIDICLTPDGNHVFLEVNAQGQWMWMEKDLDLPISRELARLLAGKSEPLVL
jgi:hypothetical protein